MAHPVCGKLRELRRAQDLSLVEAEQRYGISAVVLGSYERGDRNPPLTKIEQILGFYGYTLAAVPKNEDAVRLPTDMVLELRRIADYLELKNIHDLPQLSSAGAH